MSLAGQRFVIEQRGDFPRRFHARRLGGAAALLLTNLMAAGHSKGGNDLVHQAEEARIATVAKVAPAVVCLYDEAQRGGGSGVLIDEEGYGLTNFHVVAGMLEKRRGWGGLSDGNLYELEVLGVDPTGDVAMFRLSGREAFPYAVLGNSDAVRVGDEILAMGNPFVLSEDYTPSVSLGIVSGVHRYQHGVGGNLTYTDCIQVDAAINPGNSGGPLFNTTGEIIGINGRISVSTRGRLNVGHGYAISSSQIRRFIPALRAGLLARHGTLGATVAETSPRRVEVDGVTPGGAAERAGLRRGDRLVSFDGTAIESPNHFASVLGTYPADWPIALQIDSGGTRRRVVVRLDAVQPRMAKPFAPQREINLRAVRRVLEGFRRAVLRDATAEAPKSWQWTSLRKFETPPDSPRMFDETHLVHLEETGPARMVRRYDDGRTGPVITYDDASAIKILTRDGDAMELPTEDRMVLAALYILQRRMLAELMDGDLARVTLAGGDAIVETEGENAPPGETPTESGATPRRPPPVFEVIDWPIGEQTLAKFLFDPETQRLMRVRLRDVPTGAEATVDLHDYNWVAGMVWPHTIIVRMRSHSYRETWSAWKLGE